MDKNNINSPQKVVFCKLCVHSNQKVISSPIISDDAQHSNRARMGFEDGVCQGCLQVRRKYNQNIDWKEREKKLRKILEKYRSRNGSFDCIFLRFSKFSSLIELLGCYYIHRTIWCIVYTRSH